MKPSLFIVLLVARSCAVLVRSDSAAEQLAAPSSTRLEYRQQNTGKAEHSRLQQHHGPEGHNVEPASKWSRLDHSMGHNKKKKSHKQSFTKSLNPLELKSLPDLEDTIYPQKNTEWYKNDFNFDEDEAKEMNSLHISEYDIKSLESSEDYYNIPPVNSDYLGNIVQDTHVPTPKTHPAKDGGNKQPDNILYSSLLDMMSAADTFRVKRPLSSVSNRDAVNAADGGHDGGGNAGGSSSRIYPHVARVQDRSMSEDAAKDQWTLPKMGPWDPATTPVVTAVLGSVMLFLILVVVVLALRVHCRNRSKHSQEWVRQPMVAPTAPASGMVQPILSQQHAEPIHIRAKGLLERRGSNTSLTLELGQDPLDGLVTMRECTPEDFLLTAGNRLSRRGLRESLRDPRQLHAEFWNIPTNHPDKCSVVGAAAKNRYRTVLPNEHTQVVLRSAGSDAAQPGDEYINANYVRGYDAQERAYIATQGPLAHTTGDMWRMALQERARAIVMITRLKEKGRLKCEAYVPAHSGVYGGVTVTVKQVIEKSGYTVRQVHLQRGDEVHSSLHFWFTSWPDHKTPSSARHLLAMAAEVHATNKDGDGPAIVHCSAGIGRTGCFIGISIGVRQLLEEGAVDVLALVCQMRLDRGGMVQTAEQYEFIHRALALYEASLPVSTSD